MQRNVRPQIVGFLLAFFMLASTLSISTLERGARLVLDDLEDLLELLHLVVLGKTCVGLRAGLGRLGLSGLEVSWPGLRLRLRSGLSQGEGEGEGSVPCEDHLLARLGHRRLRLRAHAADLDDGVGERVHVARGEDVARLAVDDHLGLGLGLGLG